MRRRRSPARVGPWRTSVGSGVSATYGDPLCEGKPRSAAMIAPTCACRLGRAEAILGQCSQVIWSFANHVSRPAWKAQGKVRGLHESCSSFSAPFCGQSQGMRGNHLSTCEYLANRRIQYWIHSVPFLEISCAILKMRRLGQSLLASLDPICNPGQHAFHADLGIPKKLERCLRIIQQRIS